MASSSFARSLLAALAIILLSTTAHARLLHRVAHVSVINSCSRTRFPKLCQFVANSGNFQSEIELEVALIKQAIERFGGSLSKTNRLIAATPASDTLRLNYLNTCKEQYTSGTYDLKEAIKFLTGPGTNLDVEINLTGAQTCITTCQDELKGRGMEALLASNNKNLEKLLKNIVGLGKGLKGKTSV